MNSTSACDRGGSVALVDGGSVLLGLPGAPGCTTTGLPGSVCCAHIAEEKRSVEQKRLAGTLAASNIPRSTADPLVERGFRLRRKRESPHFGAWLNIFSALKPKGSSKTQDEEMRLSPPKSPGIPAESGHAQLEESHVTALNIIFCVSPIPFGPF
jgi:hypothetical protein